MRITECTPIRICVPWSQELNEDSLTLVQGSPFSENDLIRCHAHKAGMLLLLADRCSSSREQEDLKILFEAWAIKSYTKTVPLFVQVEVMVQRFAKSPPTLINHISVVLFIRWN